MARGVRLAARAPRAQGGRRAVSPYTVGIDFGTESGRAVLADCEDGAELEAAVYPYRHGVIDERLPEREVSLEPDWAHQAAQPEADRINEVAAERGEPWLARYGGKISSEWFFSKALQILGEAPAVYGRADRLLEAADWVVWQLTGRETRNSCTAGYKAI